MSFHSYYKVARVILLLLPLLYVENFLVAQSQSHANKNSAVEKIFKKVDTEAFFKGGPSAWVRFINKNLNISDSCLKSGGYPPRLKINFIVYKSGSVDSIQVTPIIADCSRKQIVALIKHSEGQWVPAFSGGRQVNSYVNIQLTTCFNTD